MYGDALTTKERIKDRLQITATKWDNLFDRLILSVTARIEQMCGRRFVQAEFSNELHDGSDAYGSHRAALIVKNAPIQGIAAIEYKEGTTTTPLWTAFDPDTYEVDYEAGIVYFFYRGLPRGFRNIRITYTGGFSGHSIGITSLWHFNDTPSGAVDGSNRTFTLPEDADQIIVYADGIRESAANVTFTAGTASFTLAPGRAPVSTIAVDYLSATEAAAGDIALPADLVEVCEEAVVRLFKRRDSEGKSSEGFEESQITWEKGTFSADHLATIRNYRRGYNL